MDPTRYSDTAGGAVRSERLLGIGGEFRSAAREAAFGLHRFGETRRHARWLLIAAAILNTVFLASDWRFYGTPHFWIAIPARLFVVTASLACLALLRRCRTPAGLRWVMAGWVASVAGGVTVLVSSHSELALLVVLLLPVIVYLGVPLPFIGTVVGGTLTSAALLMGYHSVAATEDSFGLSVALATLNCCLAMAVARANRLQRLEWEATCAAVATAEALAESRRTLETVFAAAPVPMVVTRSADATILQVNDACAAMFGILPEMVGTASFHPYWAVAEERSRFMQRLERDGRVDDFETQARCADGIDRTMLVKATKVTLPDGRDATIAGMIDISDRKAVELSLEWLASTDPLTKLPNRLSFFSTARAEMMRAVRLGRPLALMMIDLDHFKTINDTFGHHGGDAALRAFGRLCRDDLRGADIVGRLGGEEFGILLPDTDGPQAVVIAQDLCARLAALRLPAPNDALRLSASIGVTLVQRTDTDLDTPLARADRALYAAKRGGRARVQFEPLDTVAGLQAIG